VFELQDEQTKEPPTLCKLSVGGESYKIIHSRHQITQADFLELVPEVL
jgi:hypothetical protein